MDPNKIFIFLAALCLLTTGVFAEYEEDESSSVYRAEAEHSLIQDIETQSSEPVLMKESPNVLTRDTTSAATVTAAAARRPVE
jgi:hypothetical protein